MWAQLITMHAKADRLQDLEAVMGMLHAAEQPDSGLVRTITMQDQSDPSRVYTLVVFESEEKARAREQDPRRAEALTSVRALMSEVFDGPPEFVDLTVVGDA
jgi:quinol monooxygenase YgiN